MSNESTLPVLEGFEAWVADQPKADLRRRAAASLSGVDRPTRRHELWRFTELGPFAEARSCAADPEVELPSSAFEVGGLDAVDVDLANGRLTGAGTLEGVVIRAWTQDDVAAPKDSNLGSLEALNHAWCDRGVVIEVAAGTVVEKALHLRVWSGAGANHFPQVRVVVRMGDSSSMRLIEHHRSADSECALNLHMEVEVGANARLEHVQLTRVQRTAAHSTNLRSRVGRDGRYDHWNFVLDGGWVRNDLNCRLDAPNSHVRLMGLTVAEEKQMVDAHTRVEHAADHATSEENYRHVLDDEARVVFAGRVYVDKQIRGSDAQQNNANLLLSPTAKMNALPQLEIYNDDVKASHGSSMGQLDEDALFYLRSRGIDTEAARGLLLWGFANSIVQQLDWPVVTEMVQREVRGHLSDLPELGERG